MIDPVNEIKNQQQPKKEQQNKRYVAFLRGINVSGHHKVPMIELKKEFEKLGFNNSISILNSGNVIFDSNTKNLKNIEKIIETHLESYFNFPIPIIVRKLESIYKLINDNPFKDIGVTKDIRLYISFLKVDSKLNLELPWTNEDKSFKILNRKDGNIWSVLDLSISKTPKAMDVLEKFYGKNITTRNWNTIGRIEKKLKAND